MKKVFSSRDKVIEKFFERSQEEGRAGNVFFEGSALYSYGKHFILAQFMVGLSGTAFIAINNSSYSVTTSKHQHSTRWAAGRLNLPKIYVNGRSSGNWGVFDEYDFPKWIQSWADEVNDDIEVVMNRRKVSSRIGQYEMSISRLADIERDVKIMYGDKGYPYIDLIKKVDIKDIIDISKKKANSRLKTLRRKILKIEIAEKFDMTSRAIAKLEESPFGSSAIQDFLERNHAGWRESLLVRDHHRYVDEILKLEQMECSNTSTLLMPQAVSL